MPLAVDIYALGPTQTNCFVIRAAEDSTEAVVVDPGFEGFTPDYGVAAILVTHCHWDHLGGIAELAEASGAPVYMPEREAPVLENPQAFYPGQDIRPYSPDVRVQDEDTIEVAGLAFEVVDVPGHSPGHVAYATEGALFSGDVLFAGGVGRTDLPVRRLGHAPGVDSEALRPLPARDGRLPGPRPADHARRRARPQPVPRGASGLLTLRSAEGNPRHPPRPSSRSGSGFSARRSVSARSTAIGRSQTPGFEDTELFVRTSGGGSDIVQKEMYTFEDRGGRSLTLRPEATAPICRAYLEHGMHREPQPVKLYTVGPDVAV